MFLNVESSWKVKPMKRISDKNNKISKPVRYFCRFENWQEEGDKTNCPLVKMGALLRNFIIMCCCSSLIAREPAWLQPPGLLGGHDGITDSHEGWAQVDGTHQRAGERV